MLIGVCTEMEEMEEVQQKCDFFLNAYEMGVEKYALMFKPKEERENS